MRSDADTGFRTEIIGGSAFLVGMLYFSGFAYIHAYLGAFGISISPFGFSVPYVLVYAYPPACASHGLFVVTAVALMVVLVVFNRADPARDKKAYVPALRLLVCMGLVVAAFSLLRFFAVQAAQADANAMRRRVAVGTGHRMELMSLPELGADARVKIAALNRAGFEEHLAQITEDGDRLYFLMKTPLPGLPQTVAPGAVYAVQKSQLLYVKSEDIP